MTKDSIWVTGASGRLGTELVNKLKKNYSVVIIGTDTDVDITDMTAVDKAADIYRPNVVINCASVCSSSDDEQSLIRSYKVNALGARNLAAAARRHNAKIIQMSTDDVFDGKTEGEFTEFDTPAPLSVYGRSKLAGENFVRELNPKHVIIRSSWVYGLSGTKDDFFTRVTECGRTNTPFDVEEDKFSTPTSAKVLSDVVIRLMNKGEYGIFHASCEGFCSRLEYAAAILEFSGFDPALARPVRSAEKRGLSTKLSNLMLKITDEYTMPLWKDELERYIKGDR